jgi:hypothetical protein
MVLAQATLPSATLDCACGRDDSAAVTSAFPFNYIEKIVWINGQ